MGTSARKRRNRDNVKGIEIKSKVTILPERAPLRLDEGILLRPTKTRRV